MNDNLSKVYAKSAKSEQDYREYPEVLREAVSIARRMQVIFWNLIFIYKLSKTNFSRFDRKRGDKNQIYRTIAPGKIGKNDKRSPPPQITEYLYLLYPGFLICY